MVDRWSMVYLVPDMTVYPTVKVRERVVHTSFRLFD